MSLLSGVPLKLTQTKPDFESLVLQMQMYLSQKETWKDLLLSSTGETLIELMAAVGTFNQFGIESASRETFLSSAVRDSSIYAITRMLGVRITRKSPASVTATLIRSDSTVYPRMIQRYNQWEINGSRFFNRDAIYFGAGESTVQVQLYEGEIRTQTFEADSTVFKEIYLNEPGFVVSDRDVVVSVSNPNTGLMETWDSSDQGIWIAEANEKVYYDSTSGSGDTVLAFGDGQHGALPSMGGTISVMYVVTNGAVGNNGGSGFSVSKIDDETVKGSTVSPISNGSDEKPASYYKSLAPHLYRARNRAVNPPDYKAIASSYPGVASVTVQTQKDVAPNDLRWMNIVRICILPQHSDEFSTSAWTSFIEWFSNKAHAAVQILKQNPTKLEVDVAVEIAIHPTYTPADLVLIVENRIKAIFDKDLDTLGKRIAYSDIIDACDIDGVDYVNISTPSSDLVPPSKLHYYALRNLTVTVKYTERVFYNERFLSNTYNG